MIQDPTIRIGRMPKRHAGLTLLEVLIAMFILLFGVIGVLAALPTGVNSAQWVILQDAAMNLAASKFSEFRRDRVDPASLNKFTTYQEFAHAAGDPYENFDDISFYEWRVDNDNGRFCGMTASGGASPAPTLGYMAPMPGASNSGLMQVTIAVRMKGTTRSFRFTQYMLPYQ